MEAPPLARPRAGVRIRCWRAAGDAGGSRAEVAAAGAASAPRARADSTRRPRSPQRRTELEIASSLDPPALQVRGEQGRGGGGRPANARCGILGDWVSGRRFV